MLKSLFPPHPFFPSLPSHPALESILWYTCRLAGGSSPPRSPYQVGDGDGRQRGQGAPAGVGAGDAGGHLPAGAVEGGRGSPRAVRGDVDGVHAGGAHGVAAAVHGGESDGGRGQAGRAAGRVPDDHDAAAAVVMKTEMKRGRRACGTRRELARSSCACGARGRLLCACSVCFVGSLVFSFFSSRCGLWNVGGEYTSFRGGEEGEGRSSLYVCVKASTCVVAAR